MSVIRLVATETPLREGISGEDVSFRHIYEDCLLYQIPVELTTASELRCNSEDVVIAGQYVLGKIPLEALGQCKQCFAWLYNASPIALREVKKLGLRGLRYVTNCPVLLGDGIEEFQFGLCESRIRQAQIRSEYLVPEAYVGNFRSKPLIGYGKAFSLQTAIWGDRCWEQSEYASQYRGTLPTADDYDLLASCKEFINITHANNAAYAEPNNRILPGLYYQKLRSDVEYLHFGKSPQKLLDKYAYVAQMQSVGML